MNAIRIVKKAPASDSAKELERQAVQRLISNVQDEAHWQQILASAGTDAQREELERVCGRMLPFRRAAPCTTPGCDSGEAGIWQPSLVVACPRTPTDPSWVPIELRLCDACKQDATVRDFLTPDIWSQILTAWDGPEPPVQRLTTLAFDRIH